MLLDKTQIAQRQHENEILKLSMGDTLQKRCDQLGLDKNSRRDFSKVFELKRKIAEEIGAFHGQPPEQPFAAGAYAGSLCW